MKFPYNIIQFFKHDFIYFFQRIFRGWADNESWDLGYHIAKRFIKPLKNYRSIIDSFPSSLTVEEWEKILDKMIRSFEDLLKEDEIEHYIRIDKMNAEEHAAYMERRQEGFELFGKWFTHLWL